MGRANQIQCTLFSASPNILAIVALLGRLAIRERLPFLIADDINNSFVASSRVLSFNSIWRYIDISNFCRFEPCYRYNPDSRFKGCPSRIEPLIWPILMQNPSIFDWDMTQNRISLLVSTLPHNHGDNPFWVISQPNVDGFCSIIDYLKAFKAHHWKECPI